MRYELRSTKVTFVFRTSQFVPRTSQFVLINHSLGTTGHFIPLPPKRKLIPSDIP